MFRADQSGLGRPGFSAKFAFMIRRLTTCRTRFGNARVSRLLVEKGSSTAHVMQNIDNNRRLVRGQCTGGVYG